MSTNKKNHLKWMGVPMTSEAHLLDTNLFRGVVLLPVTLGILLIIIATSNSSDQLTFCLDPNCFNTFFSLYKFQIAVMGLAIPLGALVASHHRSIQSAEQIKAQQNQNIFSNYSKHKEFFTDLFKDEGLFAGESGLSGKAHELHAILYPNAQSGSLSPCTKRIKSFEYLIPSAESILSSCLEIDWQTNDLPEDLQEKVENHTALLSVSLNLNERFFHEKLDLSEMLTRLNRLVVTHHHLAIATTFITVNRCSENFELMHEIMSAAAAHIRKVTTEQHILNQLTELAETRQRQIQEMSRYLESELVKFLSTDSATKLKYINQLISNFSESSKTMKEVELLLGMHRQTQ